MQTLVGIEGRYNAPLQEADLALIKFAKLEAVKVSVWKPFNDLFTIFNPPTDRECAIKIKQAYDDGVRYFILHKEPNSIDYGYERWWRTGEEFSEWWVEHVRAIKEAFPEAKIGLPAMKSGADNELAQADSWDFFCECEMALEVADFYELSMRWSSWREMREQLWRLDSYQCNYNKDITITFSNPNSATSKQEKAKQYLNFYRELQKKDGVLAAFAFCISSPKRHHMFETWRGEKTGKPNIIAEVIRNRDF